VFDHIISTIIINLIIIFIGWSMLPKDGQGWQRLAKAGQCWPMLVNAGQGWPRLAKDDEEENAE